jgi:hypothetical protein
MFRQIISLFALPSHRLTRYLEQDNRLCKGVASLRIQACPARFASNVPSPAFVDIVRKAYKSNLGLEPNAPNPNPLCYKIKATGSQFLPSSKRDLKFPIPSLA